MKRCLGILAVLLLAGLSIGFGNVEHSANAGGEVTLKGEIVDLHCYVTRGAKGADHAGCSNACISRGVSPGFVSQDGKLYLLLDEKPLSVKDKVAGMAGQPVSLTGTIVERDGMKVILFKNIEPVKQGS